MTIRELKLNKEDLLKIKNLFKNNGIDIDNEDNLLNQDDFHVENSLSKMLSWKYNERNNILELPIEECDITIKQLLESKCETLGEFLLHDDCIKVMVDGKEVWLKFYL